MNETSHCKLKVKIIPASSKTNLVSWENDVLKIKIHAPPEKNKANEELIQYLSTILSISKSNIVITQGETSKFKTLQLGGITYQALLIKIETLLKNNNSF
jgi:uncharacterized protein